MNTFQPFSQLVNRCNRQNTTEFFSLFSKKVQSFTRLLAETVYSVIVHCERSAVAPRSFWTLCSLTTRSQQFLWGALTMNATSITTQKKTSRSLNTSKSACVKGYHGTVNTLAALAIVTLVLFVNSANAADTKALNTTSSTADILRQDVIQFAGNGNNAGNKPENSYVIRLNRKAANKANYGMVIRSVDATEQAMLDDAADGKWDNFNLFTAAMVAEGVRDTDKVSAYEAKMTQVIGQVNAKLQLEGSSVATGKLTRELFESLHREILTQPYDINCTEISRVFETGHFNCVSATVLFNILANRAGLDVCALEMPGHALSRIKFGTESMNVETTCPNWFELQSEIARKNATMLRVAPAPAVASNANGQSAVSATDAEKLNDASKKLREITPVQLIATIYYNKGVDFHAEKRYAEAAAANVKALQLDPNSETAWGNLMAAINNWAIEIVSDTKRYDLAAMLLDQGVYLDPTYEKFQANQLHVFYHWIYDLAREGRVADAKTVYALAAQRLPGNADLQNLMQAIDKK
jgi:hypothetical protein